MTQSRQFSLVELFIFVGLFAIVAFVMRLNLTLGVLFASPFIAGFYRGRRQLALQPPQKGIFWYVPALGFSLGSAICLEALFFALAIFFAGGLLVFPYPSEGIRVGIFWLVAMVVHSLVSRSTWPTDSN